MSNLQIPANVKAGERPQAATINGILACLRALWPQPSAEIWPDFGGGKGVSYTLARQPRRGGVTSATGATTFPFEIYKSGENWRVRRGTVQTVTSENDDQSGAPLEIAAPVNGTKVWIELDVTWGQTATVTAAVLASGAAVPAVAWPVDGSLPATLYVQLAQFGTTDGQVAPFNDVRSNLSLTSVLCDWSCTDNGSNFKRSYVVAAV
jgi:hypothetical protein